MIDDLQEYETTTNNSLSAQLQCLQSKWVCIINDKQGDITQHHYDLINYQINALQTTQSNVDEMLSEKIQKNTLLIFFSIALIFMILFYILF